MLRFEKALMDLVISAECQYQRSKMEIHLEPDLYERFTFTLKQHLPKENHLKLDSGELVLNTPVGKVWVIKNKNVGNYKLTPTPLTEEEVKELTENDKDLQK